MNWHVYSFQPAPRTNQCQRFDLLILDAALEVFGGQGHCVRVMEVMAKSHAWSNWGTFSFRDTTFEGMIGDVAIFVEEDGQERFWVVDYQDAGTGPAIQLARAPGFAGAFITMFHRPTIQREFARMAPAGYELAVPGWFTDIDPWLTAEYLEEVQAIRGNGKQLDQRLFFSGTIHGETPEVQYCAGDYNIREVAVVLREKYPDEVRMEAVKLERTEWFTEAARHAVCLALPGAPWCSREFELFHLGIPVLTYEWVSELQHRWIPNLHYMAVEGVGERHSMGFPLDTEQAADRLIACHREMLQQPEMARMRARQAQEWYERFFQPERIGREMASFILQWAA